MSPRQRVLVCANLATGHIYIVALFDIAGLKGLSFKQSAFGVIGASWNGMSMPELVVGGAGWLARQYSSSHPFISCGPWSACSWWSCG